MAESRRVEPDRAGTPGSDAPAPSRLQIHPLVRDRLRAGARGFARDPRGGTAIEYAMIGALIFAVAAGSIRLYGSKVNTVYGQIGSAMAQIN